VLNWNQLVLFHRVRRPIGLQYQAACAAPPRWAVTEPRWPVAASRRARSRFQPAAHHPHRFRPLLAGAHFCTVELGTDRAPRTTCTWPATATASRHEAPHWSRVQEPGCGNGALFGARITRDYHFLSPLAITWAHFGLGASRVERRRLGAHPGWTQARESSPAPCCRTSSALPGTASTAAPWDSLSGGADGGYDTPMKGDLLWV